MRANPSPAVPLGRHNPKIVRLRKIVQRQEPALTVIDGVKLAADLAARGVPIGEIYADADGIAAVRSFAALHAVWEAGRAFLVDARTLESLAPTRQTQGLLAVVPVPANTVTVAGVVLYLDRVQDPGNVGGVIRCAAAFGARGVACSPGCADPFSPRAVRASAGQSLLLPIQREVEFPPLAEMFRRAGGEAVGTTGGGGTALAAWRPRTPLLLVFGNEGQGLAPEVAAACRQHVRVPLAGGVESLNVAVSAGVILASLAGLAASPILKR